MKLVDSIDNPNSNQVYIVIPKELSLTPHQAYKYENELFIGATGGVDISVNDTRLYRFKYFTLYFECDFPTAPSTSFNIPVFYIYVHTNKDENSYVMRWGINLSSETVISYFNTNIMDQTYIDTYQLGNFIFDPVDSTNYVGFTFNFDNMAEYFATYGLSVYDIQKFGARFYFRNLNSDYGNWDTPYKVGIKKIRVGLEPSKVKSSTSTQRLLYMTTTGPGKVFLNGREFHPSYY